MKISRERTRWPAHNKNSRVIRAESIARIRLLISFQQTQYLSKFNQFK